MGKRETDRQLEADPVESDSRVSSEKAILESRSFKDGAIYMFIRGDYQRPTWMCRIRVPGVKGYIYRSTKTTNEHEAYKFADDLYHRTLVKVLGGADFNSRKILEAIEGYSKRFGRDRDTLSVRYRLLLLERCKPFFGKKTFADLNTALIDDLIEFLSENSTKGSLSPNSIKRIQSDLKHFLNWCVEEDYLEAIPKLPRVKSRQSRRPHFDPLSWRRLVRHLREFIKVTNGKIHRDRTLLVNYVLIMGNTGLRPGEARGLKWRDLREVRGADGTTNLILTVKGKTGNREVVASKGEVKTYFGRILKLRSEELAGPDGKPVEPDADTYIFCHPDGSPVHSFKKSFASLLRSAGLETDSFGQKRAIYSLRHTYATFRLQEGVNHYALAKNMGTSVAMLEQYYGHTSNVASADELTKRKSRSPGARKPSSSKKKTDLSWLSS